MTQEQHFPLADLRRVNVEVEVRDIVARWSARDDVVVRADGVEAFVEAEELFIGSTHERQSSQKKIEIELPLQPLTCTFKVQRGDIELLGAQGRLETRIDSGDLSVTNGSGSLNVASGKGDLKVESFRGEVTVHNGSGDKLLSDVDGDVTVHSGRGETKLIRGSGSTIINSASGDLTITARDITSLAVTSASGDVVIRGGRLGQSSIETGSGDIVCQTVLSLAAYDITAASGDMVLDVPRDLPARVDAATTRGSISSDLPLVAIAQRGPRNPHGKRVVGSTSDDPNRAEITLRTSSGDIRIQWSSEKSAAATAPERPTKQVASEAIAIPVRAPEPFTSYDGPDEIFDDDRQRIILAALADGSLSVEEASKLLDALGQSAGSTNGAR